MTSLKFAPPLPGYGTGSSRTLTTGRQLYNNCPFIGNINESSSTAVTFPIPSGATKAGISKYSQ
ncbi:MAG: hypothetical protein GY696_16655 [Gammaproteobacteria bacterium]|nr:hypothetical protein [Gammaproteobacteria bacterium]